MNNIRVVQLGTLISPAKTVRCGAGEYPVLSMTMHDGLIFQEDKFKKVVASKDTSDYKVVYRNQLVVSFPIDEGVLATQRITDAGIVSPAYGIWDIDSNQIVPEYLEYALRCERAISYYKAKLRGSTARRRSLPTPTLLEFAVPLPDIKTQEHILDVIHKVKDIISKRGTELQLLNDLVKARFVEMFGDPEYNNKGWPVKKLNDLCNVGSSKRIYQEEQTMEGIPFWRISDLVAKMDNGNVESSLYIPERRYEELKAQGLVPEPGDILVTSRGTLGRCYIISPEDRFYFQDGMISWLSKYADEITPLYIKYLFDMPGFKKQIDSMQAGSTVAYLSISMLKKLGVMLPNREEQNDFAAFVAQIEKLKITVQHALDKMQILSNSLMQKYFG